MTATLFFDPQARPLSNSGAPLPEGALTFYLTQTTTPHDVYADASLETELTNPVVADADGRFPFIYLDPSVTYRVILEDANGVEIWDVDPYMPPRDYPSGTVVWHFGTQEQRDAAYPPALWAVLDGNNGTPNGLGRMPIIAGGGFSPGDTGGSTGTVQTASTGAHDHDGAVSSTVLTSDNMPVHHHRIFAANTSSSTNADGWGKAGTRGIPGEDVGPFAFREQSGSGDQLIEDTGSADPSGHDHDISEDGLHQHDVTIARPPYVCLWALMRKYP